MVSDPKIYNPKIVTNDGDDESEDLEEGGLGTPGARPVTVPRVAGVIGGGAKVAGVPGGPRNAYVKKFNSGHTAGCTTDIAFSSKRTWISWPLAFILRSGAARHGAMVAPPGGRSPDVAVMAEKEVSMRYVARF